MCQFFFHGCDLASIFALLVLSWIRLHAQGKLNTHTKIFFFPWRVLEVGKSGIKFICAHLFTPNFFHFSRCLLTRTFFFRSHLIPSPPLDYSKGNSSAWAIPLPQKCQTFVPCGEIKSSSADSSGQPDQVGFLRSNAGLERGLRKAKMSGWITNRKKKRLSNKPAQEGTGPTNCLFLQILRL